jgi:hypothetical protein
VCTEAVAVVRAVGADFFLAHMTIPRVSRCRMSRFYSRDTIN